MSEQLLLRRRLVLQNLKMAWSRKFIPKLFVWHSSRAIVRMKSRCFCACLYTERKRSHWLKQWPIRKGLGDKKRQVVIGWKCNLDYVETLEQSTNGSSRGLGDLQGVNEFFLFAEKRIQRFDESRFQDGETKWSPNSLEDREFVLIVM